ncbi:acyltransferase family protein [Thioflexithrix psekupsensis]|uniref:Acyltransferase 3 domain-containing protein n=1 Tax=Thioflexithrix psekupsensis TaxID=1570016 RepID=A0A251X568_9GAMM|nr:acyltransferase [Thioflexithrix psekupsensis]OUD12530.1 hypothetical protein TPSD3_15695 [Thioflexithrix psekupsensis]
MSLTLAESLAARQNNFDLIRFVAATMVIFAHAYVLTHGNDEQELLHQITQHQMTFGTLGVAIFFVISGFLISQSYERSANIWIYIKARILRIFPALIVVLLLTVFLFGPVMTQLSFMEYFTSSKTYRYLTGIFLFPVHYHLPGVFENNPYPKAVNGSLWTISYEMLCYVMVAFLGVLGLMRWRGLLLVILLGLFVFRLFWFEELFVLEKKWNFWFRGIGFSQLIELVNYFLAGTVIYLYREKVILHHYLALLAMIILGVASVMGGLEAWFIIAGSYLIIYIAFTPYIRCHHFAHYGDFSYGLYIYAFPVQQTLVYLSGATWHPLLNAFVSLPVVLFFAVLSWHLIEHSALQLKNVVLISPRLKI